MIFYFSGTGNSRWVAEELANKLRTQLLFIPDVDITQTFTLEKNEKLGFVFPCYAWAIPEFIVEFIKKLKVENVSYLYYACTCGDDTGRLKEQFCKVVAEKGWTGDLGYEIKMPESYVCLPFFDVDSKEKEQRKYNVAQQRVNDLVDDLLDSRRGIFNLLQGVLPRTKSTVLKWGFDKWCMTPKRFVANVQCTQCETCVTECPMKNISLMNGQIHWGDNCVMCLRCYHSCPQHAVEWGKYTRKHGQYLKKG